MQLNYFTYKERNYPYRCVLLREEHSYYIIVSVAELEKELVDEQGIPYNKEAEYIDNKIAYYVENVDELMKDDDSTLINKIYS